jgi:hypothetical protein
MNMAHLPFYSKERGCAFFSGLDGVRSAHTSQQVGLTQSPTRLRRDGLFTCLLRQVNLPRIQLKKPSTLRVGGFVPFAGLSSKGVLGDLKSISTLFENLH